jgi:hypothetical protein
MVGDLQADVQLDKSVYAPGETIKVTLVAVNLEASAWIWLVPADKAAGPAMMPDKSLYPHREVGTTSMVDLTAGEPGRYEVRLYRSREIGPPLASRAFEVKAR